MSDNTLTLDNALTFDQIIEMGARLHPRRALGRTNGDFLAACSTPVITQVALSDGTTRRLDTVQGRYGAVYCRVSTDDQVKGNQRPHKRETHDATRADRMRQKRERERRGETDEAEGLSVRDQIIRCVEYFIAIGQAFRIFSDISLTGGLPPMIPSLITSMYETKADGYRKAFNVVFGIDKKWTPTNALDTRSQRLIEYRDGQIEKIKRGGYKTDTHGITGTVEGSDKRATERTKPYYRPALTVLLDSLPNVHTVAVTDISRLSRAHELTVELMKRFSAHGVEIAGTIESAEMFNAADEDWGADLGSTVLSKVAARKITEQATGAMRGALRKLEQGKAPNALPWWLTKGDNDKAVLVPERAEIVKDAAHRYLAGESIYEIANRLNAQGYRSPWGTDWRYDTLRKWLGEKAIIGKLEFFGLEWPIYPALIPVEMWERIQERLHTRGTAYAQRIKKKHPTRLLSGLLRCATCGKSLTLKQSGSMRGQVKYGCVVGHPLLPADDLDRFFGDLMQNCAGDLLDEFRAGMRGEELQAEIESLRARREEISREITARREAARPAQIERARAFLGDDFNPDDEYVRSMIEAGVRKALSSLYEEEQAVEHHLKTKQSEYDLLLPPSVTSEIEQCAKRWPNLDADEKNRLLKQLFVELTHVIDGDGERIVPRLRSGAGLTLPPIPIEVSAGPSNGHGPTTKRVIPSLLDWRVDVWLRTKHDDYIAHAEALPDGVLESVHPADYEGVVAVIERGLEAGKLDTDLMDKMISLESI